MSRASNVIAVQGKEAVSLLVGILSGIREAVEAERERCAKLAELDSVLDWAGGSTGNAKGTAIRIARAIRAAL